MAIGIVAHVMTPLPQTTQPTRTGLRRATYVHVSDLTSAYNINHARLEQELARVKADRQRLTTTASKVGPDVSDHDDFPSGTPGDMDSALGSLPQKRLQPPRGGYNLCVLVGKVNVVVDKRRVDRSRVRLAEVEIGDETGTVSLRARDEQIDVLEEVSGRHGAVVLRNCTLELYQGKHIRLAVTKWGKLCTYPDQVASTPPPPSKMNYDRNFSLIDLSVVASDMVDSQPESSYILRPSKPSESSEAGGTGSSGGSGGLGGGASGGGRANVPKSGLSSHHKHQQFQQPQQGRRSSRGGDRRQPRNKMSGGAAPSSHVPYGGAPAGTEGSVMQPPAQMQYQGMHAFPARYDQSMDLRRGAYSFPHNRQQEVMTQASAHQMMFQQQYEMQQRQLQQMYQSQQERHRSNLQQGHQLQPSTMLMPAMVASGTPGDYPVSSYATAGADQHPSLMTVVGSAPLLIPMNMAGARSQSNLQQVSAAHNQAFDMSSMHQGGSRDDATQQQEHQQKGVGTKQSSQQSSFASSQELDRQRQQQQQMQFHHSHSRSPRAESPFSPGKMNPQASVFAPSYINPQGNIQGSHQHAYYPVEATQGSNVSMYGTVPQHPGAYTQGVMYSMTGASSGSKTSTTSQESTETGTQQSVGGSGVAEDPDASGKENVQSGR